MKIDNLYNENTIYPSIVLGVIIENTHTQAIYLLCTKIISASLFVLTISFTTCYRLLLGFHYFPLN